MAGRFRQLLEEVFGKREGKKILSGNSSRGDKRQKSAPAAPPVIGKATEREPFFIQIGLDFGTAFSKCICRDLELGSKTWIYCPEKPADPARPFLISSAIVFADGILSHPAGLTGSYSENGLNHVKMALEKVSLGKWDDPVLISFRKACPDASDSGLSRFVEGCAVYLLAGILGGVKADVRARFQGQVEGDYMAVNMAVPAADADHPEVDAVFNRVLRTAWVIADQFARFPPVAWGDLNEGMAANQATAETGEVVDACFLYPEVSANVQCFVRSRASQEGIYLFSDTGAGTVDQSVFIFTRRDGREQLTYLDASVLPLGSSQIERIAAGDGADWKMMDALRRRKEGKSTTKNKNAARRLKSARGEIASKLLNGTTSTVRSGKMKLIRRRQIDDLKVLFGGGGHCQSPYAKSALEVFESGVIHPDAIDKRRKTGGFFDLGLPVPDDLDLKPEQESWISRLTVAYGLSFQKDELAAFILPRAIEPPHPDEVWQPKRGSRLAPSKDDC